MIIRKGNIEYQGKLKPVSELSEEDTNRFNNALELFKTELNIVGFAFITITNELVYSIGYGVQKKIELTSLSEALKNEITWLKTLIN